MSKLQHLFIHCLDTPKGKNFNSGDVNQWHLGPKDLSTGEVKYMKKVYPSREELPDEYINGFNIKTLHGRGWSQVGYSDLILLNGTVENLVAYNSDNWIDTSEITNGAAGFNGNSRHIAIVGGMGFSSDTDFDDVLTPEQFVSLQVYVKEFLGHHPECKVLGHYQVNPNKNCPGFDVPNFLRFISIPEKFIYKS